MDIQHDSSDKTVNIIGTPGIMKMNESLMINTSLLQLNIEREKNMKQRKQRQPVHIQTYRLQNKRFWIENVITSIEIQSYTFNH